MKIDGEDEDNITPRPESDRKCSSCGMTLRLETIAINGQYVQAYVCHTRPCMRRSGNTGKRARSNVECYAMSP